MKPASDGKYISVGGAHAEGGMFITLGDTRLIKAGQIEDRHHSRVDHQLSCEHGYVCECPLTTWTERFFVYPRDTYVTEFPAGKLNGTVTHAALHEASGREVHFTRIQELHIGPCDTFRVSMEMPRCKCRKSHHVCANCDAEGHSCACGVSHDQTYRACGICGKEIVV